MLQTKPTFGKRPARIDGLLTEQAVRAMSTGQVNILGTADELFTVEVDNDWRQHFTVDRKTGEWNRIS